MRLPAHGVFAIQGGVFALVLFLLCPVRGWADVPLLDEAAVFCSYYSLSGGQPENRDIEEFCWSIGEPTFSDFKPAEMFSGNSLRRVRRALNRRIHRMGPHTLFRWGSETVDVRRIGDRYAFRLSRDRHGLPRATPFIQAEISPAGWKRLKRTLSSLSPNNLPGTGTRKDVRIGILVRPRRVEDRLETRNIARMDVMIPIRSVVFQPVALEAESDAGKTRIPVQP